MNKQWWSDLCTFIKKWKKNKPCPKSWHSVTKHKDWLYCTVHQLTYCSNKTMVRAGDQKTCMVTGEQQTWREDWKGDVKAYYAGLDAFCGECTNICLLQYSHQINYQLISELWRQTDEEVGRQHQGMDRPGVRQVPDGSGGQRKMEEVGCEIICGAPATLRIKR